MPHHRERSSARIWDVETETGRVSKRRVLLEGFELALRTEKDREARARLEARIEALRAVGE